MRVLVVDDNVDAADSLRMVLEAQGGHIVRVAYDGASGLAAAGEFHPDAVLLDIGAQGMDGYEGPGGRSLPGLEQTPIVALTGYGRTEDRARLVCGVHGHQKPVIRKSRELLLNFRG